MDGDRVIGGYALRRVLGRGGMGEVHLATTPTGGLAAVKLIHPALARDPAFRRRFDREVAAARRVARFCTAPVLDAGIDGEVAYLVTEYVKGPDLAQAVHDQGPLSGGNLEALAVGIATALSAIHGAGVIHRDLKPSNVLLSPLGPRVIDFGIAQLVDNDSLASQAILGTPAFMAPEQVRGEPLTPAADVFAWGGVIAFAGTGRLPFGGGAPGEVLYRIMQDGPRLEGLEEGIRGIVERALAKDPRLRPGAQALLSELVGGTRLAAATEVVERTWTGTVPTGLRPTPVPGTRVLEPPSGPQPSDGRSLLRPGNHHADQPPARLGHDHGGPLPAWPGDDRGGRSPARSGDGREGQPPVWPGDGREGRSPARPPEGPGDGREGPPPVRRGKRRWPWAAGAAVLVAAVTAAVTVPGLLRVSWPYEAGFGKSWAVGPSEGGNARLAGPAYELTVKPSWRLWKSAPRREPEGGVIVSAKATLEEGAGEYGVWCHGSARSGDRYEFAVNGSGRVTIVKRRTGTRGQTLFGPADAEKAAGNRIVAECGQSGGKVTLRMWLNERLVAQVSDADAPYGPDEAGVHAASGATEPARVRFDSFALRPVGE
ncbi:protein kinase domain-containing protein [Nonomuraea sp. KM88]|uniref:protein kinase domain-containing protein n=1 Tax=Nonomuraea sp. KM88 TaxID=3457427 RepID=UPI003FCE39E8